MAKENKRKLREDADGRIHTAICAEELEDISLEQLMAVLPGGKGREAVIMCARALASSPGLTMEDMLRVCRTDAEMDDVGGTRLLGTPWVSPKSFGTLGLLWDRTKVKLPGDLRARWHYYILPPGKLLTAESIDPRAEMIEKNNRAVQACPKPGDLLVTPLECSYKMKMSEGDLFFAYQRTAYCPRKSRNVVAGDPEVYLVLGYAAKLTDPANKSSLPRMLEVRGPEDSGWHEAMRSRALYLVCMQPATGNRLAAAITRLQLPKV
jgi:hypothetical protein